MLSKLKINSIPFRILSFLYVIYNNSSFATIGKNAGFFCDDESIKKPYHGDSVHVVYLFSVLLCLFPIFIYASERLYKKEIAQYAVHSPKFHCKLMINYYYSGFLHILAVIEVFKVFVTELRPHFYYTCLPDMKNIDCSKGLITEFNCTGDGESWLIDRDIYKSFPSGHAALSSYGFIFISVYLYSIKKGTFSNCLNIWWSRIIPVLGFIWAVICCISRVIDNRHFWWDVLSGMCIGLVGGLTTVYLALAKTTYKSASSNN